MGKLHPMNDMQFTTSPNECHSPKRLLVSRHPGARRWLERQGIRATTIGHLDLTMVASGDQVIGTLPLHLAAAVCSKGARFFHLTLDVPESLRGHEIDPETMDALGARLEEFVILREEVPPALVD